MEPVSVPVSPKFAIRQAQVQPRNPIKKRLYIGQLTASSTTLYTAPSAPTIANSVGLNPVAEIVSLWICNTDVAARTVTLYVVENGGSAAANRAIFSAFNVAAGDTYKVTDAGIILEAGDTLRGLASVTSVVTVSAYGIEYT